MTRKLEQAFQIQVAEYLAAVLPPEVAWTAFPAGGGGKKRGAFLKAMGLKPGWPDIQILFWYHSRFEGEDHMKFLGLELKAPKGKLSKAQKAARKAINAVGGGYAVCRDLDAVAAALRSWGVPMRAHTFYATGATKLEETA